MANASKVIYGGKILIDLTSDTVEPSKLASGITAHDKSGTAITGTNTFDADTSDGTATASELLDTKTAYVGGSKIEGTMPNRGAISGYITKKDQAYVVQNGYHDGSGTVAISSVEQAKIIGTNIRKGVEILGVTGTMEEDTEVPESLSVTPYTTSQKLTPSTGHTCFREVDVEAIYYNETVNAAGGVTVTIGKVAPTI